MTTKVRNCSSASPRWTSTTRPAPRPRSCASTQPTWRTFGRGSTLLEYGAGAGIKTEILLDALDTPRVYVPIDIAGDFLDLTVTRMRARFPEQMEEHTSELQSLMRTSYAVFCLKKKKQNTSKQHRNIKEPKHAQQQQQ